MFGGVRRQSVRCCSMIRRVSDQGRVFTAAPEVLETNVQNQKQSSFSRPSPSSQAAPPAPHNPKLGRDCPFLLLSVVLERTNFRAGFFNTFLGDGVDLFFRPEVCVREKGRQRCDAKRAVE